METAGDHRFEDCTSPSRVLNQDYIFLDGFFRLCFALCVEIGLTYLMSIYFPRCPADMLLATVAVVGIVTALCVLARTV